MKTLKNILLATLITFSLNSLGQSREATFSLVSFETDDDYLLGHPTLSWDKNSMTEFKFLKIAVKRNGVAKRLMFVENRKDKKNKASLIYKCKEVSTGDVKGEYLYEELSSIHNDNLIITLKTSQDYVVTLRIVKKDTNKFIEFIYEM